MAATLQRIDSLLDDLEWGTDMVDAEDCALELSRLLATPRLAPAVALLFTEPSRADAWHTCAGLITGPQAGLCRAFAQMAQCRGELHA